MDNLTQSPTREVDSPDSAASTQSAVHTPRPTHQPTASALPFMVSITESQLPFSVVHQEEPSVAQKQEDVAEEQGATAPSEEENEKDEVQAPATADSAYSSGYENTPEQPEAVQQAIQTEGKTTREIFQQNRQWNDCD